MNGLVFAAIMPHGYLAIPEACQPEDGDLGRLTQQGMADLAQRFDAAEPDLIVLITPHHIHVEGHLAIINAGRLAGNLSSWTTQQVELSVSTDLAFARSLQCALNDADIPTVGVSYGGNSAATATAPMDWGTLIPLWYAGARASSPRPVVVMTPARDLPDSAHVRAGEVLAEVAAASGKRVAFIASADQAHAHREGPPYGFHPAAKVYDDWMVDLIRRNDLESLLRGDRQVLADAVADSYWQTLMLHGATRGWRGELVSYEVPTYFGMLCAAFEPGATG